MPIYRARPLVWVLLLAACAAPDQRPPVAGDWSQHSAQLSTLTHWTTRGKLALRTEDQTESAQLIWRQLGQDSHLKLTGPLGVNATEVHSDGQQIQLIQGEDIRSFDITQPEVVKRNTGWDLPLQSLPYWLKGLPSPHLEVQSQELDPQRGLLRHLVQDDWQIHYQAYDDFDAYTMPTRLLIERGNTAVKVLLREWRPGPG